MLSYKVKQYVDEADLGADRPSGPLVETDNSDMAFNLAWEAVTTKVPFVVVETYEDGRLITSNTLSNSLLKGA